MHALWKAKTNLELVYLDVCEPIKPVSNGGNMYFVTFRYDFSRKTWIYFMYEKDSVFDVFKQFKA